MRIIFLESLDNVAKDMPAQFLFDHNVLIGPAPGQLPAGYKDSEAIVWSRTPIDAAFIDAIPNLRFMQRLGRFRDLGDASHVLQKKIPYRFFLTALWPRGRAHSYAPLRAFSPTTPLSQRRSSEPQPFES